MRVFPEYDQARCDRNNGGIVYTCRRLIDLSLIAGATATMEAWTTEEKSNASWSHPWCSGPNSIIIRLLLGVKPIMPGWSRMSFMPQPSSLSWINATVATSKGSIPVSFKQTAAVVTATVDVPEGVAAKACLPPAHALSAELVAATVLTVDGAPVATVNERVHKPTTTYFAGRYLTGCVVSAGAGCSARRWTSPLAITSLSVCECGHQACQCDQQSMYRIVMKRAPRSRRRSTA